MATFGIRAAAAILVALIGGGHALAQSFRVGDRVRASPSQVDNGWYESCIVRDGPNSTDYYQVDCGGPPFMWVPSRWMQPAAGAAQRQTSPAGSRAPGGLMPPEPVSRPRTSTPLRSLPPGPYRCWSFSSPRLLLNFTVLGPGRYRASDGSTGTFGMSGGTVRFTGFLANAVPAGWTVAAESRGGIPTVSFRSARNSEAAFCQRA